jgi:hypothetical protein
VTRGTFYEGAATDDTGGVATDPGGPDAPWPAWPAAPPVSAYDPAAPVDRFPIYARMWHTGASPRETPTAERAVRIAAALLALVLFAIAVAAATAGPRKVADPDAVLRDAAAGRVVRVDDRGDRVRWQTRDGGLYEATLDGGSPLEVEASVRRQPAVAANPGSVTFGRIARPATPRPVRLAGAALVLACVIGLFAGPQPRLLTRWAWFWAIGAGLPVTAAYLLFGGSWRHGRPGVPRRRVGGITVVVVAIGVNALVPSATDAVVRLRNPAPAAGTYAPFVTREG